MLEGEIKKQKKVDMLMSMKKQKLAELKEIDIALRQLIYRKRWESQEKQMQRGSMSTYMVFNQNHRKSNYGI